VEAEGPGTASVLDGCLGGSVLDSVGGARVLDCVRL